MARRRNPELVEDDIEQAQEVSRGFHGRGNREEFEEIEQEQYRQELACLGELVELEIYNEATHRLLELTFSRDSEKDVVKLACSSDRRQLFLVGGDQALEDDFLEKVNPQSYLKDKVVIGYCYSISYFADKHHLTGPKQQKYGTEYIHEFGEQTGPKWKALDKLASGLLPLVIYDRLNCKFELTGGVYEVRDEGIWD